MRSLCWGQPCSAPSVTPLLGRKKSPKLISRSVKAKAIADLPLRAPDKDCFIICKAIPVLTYISEINPSPHACGRIAVHFLGLGMLIRAYLLCQHCGVTFTAPTGITFFGNASIDLLQVSPAVVRKLLFSAIRHTAYVSSTCGRRKDLKSPKLSRTPTSLFLLKRALSMFLTLRPAFQPSSVVHYPATSRKP